METPLVTCGFTTFNSENTIKKALTSALKQDYKNIEILIVDDNSVDLTVENIYSLLSTKNISFKVIKHCSNLGVAQARNTLLKNANGEFLAFFDSDDYSLENRISEQLNHILLYEKHNFNKGEKCTFSPLCYCDREIIFNSNKKIYCKAMKISKTDYQYKEQIIGSLLFCDPFPNSSETGSTATCMLLARTKVLRALNGFNPVLRRYEDLDLAIKAVIKNIPISKINKSLVKQYYKDANYKKNEFRYEIRLIYQYKTWLMKRGLYRFAFYFINLKNNFLNLNLKNFIYYLFLIIIENPFLFCKRIISSFNTFLFSLKIKFIKNYLND
ncbi:glycosyltransferase family 2 protein [Prochlorococcus marinus]|uniref:glycosyltransferase family 2 protein n=1 Tax=Prochlorococcus marinus TaxID=1219 RepID=UPI000190058F|nr:glycosyltransferase family 2 protein [Prochlorococcus marinus]EEE40504.1 glycosyltransferase [Prochlorococcus marinus str. MIT 9202]